MTRENQGQAVKFDLRGCIEKIAKLSALVYSREAHWKANELVLFPPATEQEIDTLSQDCPVPLPNSYREFLRITNGCLNFWPCFAFLGTKGEPREIIEKKVKDAREFLSQYAAGNDGKITPESIAAFETPTESGQEFFLPNHLVFGNDRSSEFYMFNETVVSPEGEFEVVHYNYSGGADPRYPSFRAFLLETITELEERIKKKGYAK